MTDDIIRDHLNYFAIVPAAGIGRRMGLDKAKQYVQINGKTLLEHTLEKLLQESRLKRIIVALNKDDKHWQSLQVFSDPRIHCVVGGSERSESVMQGLKSLEDEAADSDWVLVHDVARPCIELGDIERLIVSLSDNNTGGILAVPASDTMKKVDSLSQIQQTLNRDMLWHALTPQMFRYTILYKSLSDALEKGLSITDEASAIEAAGLTPIVVEGSRRNIKVTKPEDLALAEFYLTNKT